MKRVAINGFGRIGRTAARIIMQRDDMQLVAINDPSKTEMSAHLFEFDTNFGRYAGTVEIVDADTLKIDGHTVEKFTTRNISELPWGELNVDIVLECTGAFRTKEGCQQHIDQGAKKVLLSAPPKGDGFKMLVKGVNDEALSSDDVFVSNASCTTNCLAPVAQALDAAFGIEHGLVTTIHSYTTSQNILDAGHKDARRSRAAAENLIPTTTGAAKAVGIVLPQLSGKLNGMAVRVPSPTVSLVDLVVTLKKDVTAEEVNTALKAASAKAPDVLGFEPRPLVSSDYKMDSRSSIVDAGSTMALGGNMIKVLSWYDNEWGYTERLIDIAAMM